MTAKRKPKPKTGRKQGAQTQNKNAQRHGFYSKSFSADETKRLDAQDEKDVLDVLSEINLIRVCVERLNDQISFEEITRTDGNGTEFRDTHYLAQLNTLSAMTQSIATLVRTHFLTRGKSGDVQQSILTALEELRLEMGL
jgi:uncharacterized protein YjcR